MLFNPVNKDVYPKLTSALQVLQNMLGYLAEAHTSNIEDRERLIKVIETHDNVLSESLNEIILITSKKLILPIDREDIHAITSAIIYIKDYTINCANKMTVYYLDAYSEAQIALINSIASVSKRVKKAVLETENISKNSTSIIENCLKIKTITASCRADIDDITIQLFSSNQNTLEIIKQLELLKVYSSLIKQFELLRRQILNTVIKFS